MLRVVLCVIAFCALVTASPSRVNGEPYAVPGTEQHDMAAANGRIYRVMIARPAAEPPAGGFPVVYALDGNAVFGTLTDILRGAEIRQALMGTVLGGIEPAVIVAIGYPGSAAYDLERRAYDYTPEPGPARIKPEKTAEGRPQPQGGADEFLAFIEHELKPKIAREFPVDPARQALFGHSYGALFALHVLFTRPDAFDTYVASSPSLWWSDGYIEQEAQAFAARAGTRPASTRLILSIGEYEQALSPRERSGLSAEKAEERNRRLQRRAMVDASKAMAKRLQGLPGLAVRFRLHEGETHGSVVPIAYARAMELIWRD